MKKVFTLFVALMAVVSLSAKKVYLAANDSWKEAEAVLFVHSWGGENIDPVQMSLVEGEEYLFEAEIPDGNKNLLFARMAPGSTTIDWGTVWTKTADLELPDDKDCFWMIGWTQGTWLIKGERPAVSLVGNFEGDATWGEGAHPMVAAGDNQSASVTFNIPAGEYEMKVWVAGQYLSLNGEGESLFGIHRDWNHADNVNLVGDGRNFKLTADITGEYTFTWSYFKRNLVVTFPSTTPTEIVNAVDTNKAVKRIVNGQLVIERDGVRYNALGTEVR